MKVPSLVDEAQVPAKLDSRVSDQAWTGAALYRYGGFLFARTLASSADALVLVALTQLADCDALVAGPFAIATAMAGSSLPIKP